MRDGVARGLIRDEFGGSPSMRLLRFPQLGPVRERLKLARQADKLEAVHGDAAVDVVDARIRAARDRSERAALYRLRDEITRRSARPCADAAFA
jgi:hypothetical protein